MSQQTGTDWFIVRRALRAADLLWTYVRIGDNNDVSQCLAAIESIPAIASALSRAAKHSAAKRRRKSSVLVEARQSGLDVEEMGTDNPVLWRDILAFGNAVSADAAYLPLFGLRRRAKQMELEDLDPQHSGVERDSSGKISFRWYRYDAGSGDLFARILARGLHFDISAARQALARPDGFFSWRIASPQASTHLFLRGTHEAADIRLTATANGGMELIVSALNQEQARPVLDRIIGELSHVAPEVPAGGVRAVVESELAESRLREI